MPDIETSREFAEFKPSRLNDRAKDVFSCFTTFPRATICSAMEFAIPHGKTA